MIPAASKLNDLPPELLAQCRAMGWSDDEIIENLEDAADFLNARFYCDESPDYLSVREFFERWGD